MPQVVGSAIALHLLLDWPLWLGVLATASSVLVFLSLSYLVRHRRVACLREICI